jgi:multidrug resistance efflux pump
MDEKRMLRKIASENHRHISHELVASARLKIEEAYAQFRRLKVEYQRLKEVKMHEFGARVEILRADLQHAREALKQATAEWVHLCGRLGVPSYQLVLS